MSFLFCQDIELIFNFYLGHLLLLYSNLCVLLGVIFFEQINDLIWYELDICVSFIQVPPKLASVTSASFSRWTTSCGQHRDVILTMSQHIRYVRFHLSVLCNCRLLSWLVYPGIAFVRHSATRSDILFNSDFYFTQNNHFWRTISKFILHAILLYNFCFRLSVVK